jgi:hypothetical protein
MGFEMQSVEKTNLLDMLAKYAVIGEVFAIIVAVISIWIQWAQENDLGQAENVRALVEQAADFQYTIIGSDQLTDIWYSYGKKPDITPTQRQQYKGLLTQWLIIHENLYYQFKNGLFDEELYHSWDIDLKMNLNKHDLSVLEMKLSEAFPSDFGKHLVEIQKNNK